MTRYALTLEFDGAPFMGLQRQNHGMTVQQAVEDAVLKFSGQDVRMQSAGRTDAGVHAYGMVSHIDLDTDLSLFRMQEAINACLRPHPVAVTHIAIKPDDWHSRFDCTGRSYIYKICNRRAPLTFERGNAWQIPQELDAEAMHDAAQILTGLHDFTTFRSVNCQSQSPVKTLDRLDVYRKDEWVFVEAEARSFLHHQVRSMVGCLALVGMGRWDEARLKDALEAKDRQMLGINAPPHGLYFVSAQYPNET
ncbi:tRNA pseudouridine(38-40) synthase TruA [Altererythrobacter sp. RZ02]|uniref:tRNA pseudouridine synthase A n=1 Tax=Pontixanthobacter rizhaonensis TaxID=2730337 RepID=A0A848QJ87_9SPHN|nr:tRNA pseudouridine(38-40) synthase TruA [Pontixanthobacter rizhaonensis]NMW30850.1 tRNA pseudouridine(38-40) synthase TruA [Pontixanthobacter rizhaonensis]